MLSSYIRNPITFYYQKILGLKDDNQMEETIAYNTIGSIIHDTLKEMYRPCENKFLLKEDINGMLKIKDKIVDKNFQKIFSLGKLTKGKNLIIVETAKRYIENFLKKEIKDLQEGNEIKILAIEKKFDTEVYLSNELNNIRIRGQIDRIDSVNGVTRVIDYKTGQIKKTDLNIKQYEEIFYDKKYSNIFQLLFYCLAIEDDNKYNFAVEAGIISFRNLDNGIIKTRFQDKTNLVSHEKIKKYKSGLDILIKEVIRVDIPFTEKKE